MNLVDYEHAVFAFGRRHHHLVYDVFYVFHAVVACCVEFYDVERAVFVKLPAGIALVARFAVGSTGGAIDCLGKNTGARCFAYSSAAAEEVGMGKAVAGYGIFQCACQCLLAYHAFKGRRTVFSR